MKIEFISIIAHINILINYKKKIIIDIYIDDILYVTKKL